MASKKTAKSNSHANAEGQVSAKGQTLLKALVELYIKEGQPVGSKVLAEESEISVSSATVRNLMVDLEDKGFVTSPHTSAGRVPTAKGYRFFVDSLLQVGTISKMDLSRMTNKIDPDMTSQEMVESVSNSLSEITSMAGLVTLPRIDQLVMRHIEFLRLDDSRALLILVLDDHEVQNRVIQTLKAYSEIELNEASNFLNHHFSGQTITAIHGKLVLSMKSDSENMDNLMKIVVEMAAKAFGPEERKDYVLSGQENLIELARSQALEDIRDLFKVFTLKGELLHLLDRCMDSEGIHLVIGEESGHALFDDCSLVTSTYEKDGEPLGALGVIGPTRMAYDRIIPIVNTGARLLSAALNKTPTPTNK